MIAYRNKNLPDQVVVREEPDPRLDALPNWERVEGDVPKLAETAIDRANAERSSIEEAARRRLEDAKGEARGHVNRAQDTETTLDNADPATPTIANVTPEGDPGVRALDKEHPRRKVEGTSPYDELRQQYEHDVANPPTTGVLSRAHADQREGRVQIGPNPEQHPRGRTEVAQAANQPFDEGGVLARGQDGQSDPNRVATEGAEGGGGTEHGEDGEAAESESDVPAKSAKKEDWVRFAVERRGLSEEEANGLTRDELIERYAQ